jgi:sec-independent protein translocase protein TatB
MFEFDAGKLIIIGIVALIVIGPKEFPRVMRYVGEALAKMRRMGVEFRAQFLEAMREAEFEDIKSGVEKIAAGTKPALSVDPLAQIKAEITGALEAARTPATAPSADAAVPAAPQLGPAPPHALASEPINAQPGAEHPTIAEASNAATHVHEIAAGQTINSGTRALADTLAAEPDSVASMPKSARLEQAQDNG